MGWTPKQFDCMDCPHALLRAPEKPKREHPSNAPKLLLCRCGGGEEVITAFWGKEKSIVWSPMWCPRRNVQV